MKLLPHWRAIVSFFTLTAPLFAAQAVKPLAPVKVESRLKLYQKLSTLKTSFDQVKRIKDMNLQIRSSGKMTLIRPDRVIWEVLKPSKMKLTLDKGQITLVSGEGAAAKTQTFGVGQQIDENASRSMANVMVWLKLDVPAIQQAYDVYPAGENAFRCVPKKLEEALFTGLTLKLHPKGHLETLLLDEKSGDQLEISFSKPEITYQK